jgi:ferredoxin--NADP+ reductase
MDSPEDKFYRARIIERKDFAPDLWSIRVDPGARFKFAPGQYATLGVETPAKRIERAYSIVSSPYEEQLEFFFELVPLGQLTPNLYPLKPGDQLTMRKVPKGRFTLDTQSGRTRHLLICTVTGIAPFVSYARTRYRDWKEGKFPEGHQLYLLGGASRSWEFGYREELERIASEVPWLTYVATISRAWEDPNWRGETGRVDDLIRKYADIWRLPSNSTTAYLCGHPEMIEHGKGILQRAGFAKENVREEVYWIPAKKS